jgi:hypothetical protein
MLPVVPFMYLALAGLLVGPRSRVRAAALALVGVLAVAGFIVYYPLLTARPVERAAWLARVGFFNGCGAAQTAPITRPGPPPPGWCWR